MEQLWKKGTSRREGAPGEVKIERQGESTLIEQPSGQGREVCFRGGVQIQVEHVSMDLKGIARMRGRGKDRQGRMRAGWMRMEHKDGLGVEVEHGGVEQRRWPMWDSNPRPFGPVP